MRQALAAGTADAIHARDADRKGWMVHDDDRPPPGRAIVIQPGQLRATQLTRLAAGNQRIEQQQGGFAAVHALAGKKRMPPGLVGKSRTQRRQDFVKGFIPGAIFIGVDGSLASWVGALIPDLQQPILFVADPGREEEVVDPLARVGYDNAMGYLDGGMQAWKVAGEDIDTLEEVTPKELLPLYKQGAVVLDVRKTSEFDAQHVEGSQNFPLDFINKNMSQIQHNTRYYVSCATGYRSLIAASILKSRGYDNVVNVVDGLKGIMSRVSP